MNTGPAGFRQIETYYDPRGYEDYVELYSEVNWEIIGLDSRWFEQAFSSKYRVVRILSNICDSSVVGERLGRSESRCRDGRRSTVLRTDAFTVRPLAGT